MAVDTYTKPKPVLSSTSRPYWEYAKAHEFRLQKCDSCAKHWFPPSAICPHCLSESYTWALLSGKAKVWSFIRIWQRYFPGFEEDLPYVVVYVQLEEGPRMMAGIVDCPYEQLSCDMDVQVCFDDITEEFALPKFTAVDPQQRQGG